MSSISGKKLYVLHSSIPEHSIDPPMGVYDDFNLAIEALETDFNYTAPPPDYPLFPEEERPDEYTYQRTYLDEQRRVVVIYTVSTFKLDEPPPIAALSE